MNLLIKFGEKTLSMQQILENPLNLWAAVDIVTSKFVESIKNRNQSDIEKSFKEIECYTKNVMTDFLEKIMQIVPILPPLEPLEFVE